MDAALGETRTIPARSGKAVRVTKGQTINVINTHGEQVVDTWAFNAGDLCEFMSMEHTRATILKLIPQVGDTLRTNRRRPILTLREDTSPGVHDTLLAACDDYRYRLLGCNEYHDNCTDNLFAGLQELGPRFTLKLRRIDRGIQRASGQEWEWKARTEKVRTKLQL